MASRTLSGMTSRIAFSTFVLNEKVDFEELVYTTTRLWCNGLRIEHHPFKSEVANKS